MSGQVAIPDRGSVLENLSALRQEWEVAAEGDSLIDVSASVGLLLFDVSIKLGLTPEEQAIFLGGELYEEVIMKCQSKSM